ncbi:MAG: leucyl aminopeptidase family protein [Alphaproteobacteria bacterium]
MKDLFVTGDAGKVVPIEPVSLRAFPGWLEAQTPVMREWAALHAFAGEAGQIVPVGGAEGALTRVVAGTGEEDTLSLAALPPLLPEGNYALSTELDERTAPLVMLAWCLGAYAFDRFRSEPQRRPSWPRLHVPAGMEALVAPAIREAGAVFLTRDLINTPAEQMGPAELEQAARDLAEEFGATVSVTAGDDLLKARLGLIHAVGRASTRAPRLIDLTWGEEDAPRLTLVGKGVCFDTGGLNLKPGGSMALMKKDMGGAAHVLGLARLVMASGLPVRLRVLVPAVENAVSGNAFRPGDILTSHKGLTVEIGNTDAEGRLILADALSLADEEAPDMLIDIATLTGAARTALGPELVPFYTSDDAVAHEVEQAAALRQDPVWRMPLWRPYEAWLESPVADLNHIADNPMAGSVIAALFLGRFVEHAGSWTHFDIYGWQPSARAGRPKGGAAQAIRALFGVLERRYGAGAGPARPQETENRRRQVSGGGSPG